MVVHTLSLSGRGNMNNERKAVYQQRMLEDMRKENKELKDEIEILNKAIKRKDEQIAALQKRHDDLQAVYDKVCFEASEGIERAAEAEAAFRERLGDLKKLEKTYKTEMEQLLRQMQKQIRKEGTTGIVYHEF